LSSFSLRTEIIIRTGHGLMHFHFRILDFRFANQLDRGAVSPTHRLIPVTREM
jgi:hypothetical protein